MMLPTLPPPRSGYEDMEAQFAWDDKTIRQTFIRKVQLCHVNQLIPAWRLIVGIALIQCPFSCRCTPFSWFSCWPQWPLLHSSHSGNHPADLFISIIIITTTLIKPWSEYSECLSPQCTCKVFHSDSSWLVHGILVSENSSSSPTLQCRLFFSYSRSHCLRPLFGSLMFFATYIALSCCGELR